MENNITQKMIMQMSDYNIDTIEHFDSSINCINNFNYVQQLYWQPNPYILNMLVNYCASHIFTNNSILEVGPGFYLFPLAKKNIRYNNNENINENDIYLDIDENILPFTNKYIDFIYCRHTLEDLQNPKFALKEMIRTSKHGYIETPSPLVECIKGIDTNNFSHIYCGYLHHRYIIWTDMENNTIYFLPKYGMIENLANFHPLFKQKIIDILNNYCIYWNTYFIWKDGEEEPNIVVYKNWINIGLNNNLAFDYATLLEKAIRTSIKSTNYFIRNYSHLLNDDRIHKVSEINSV